MRLLRLRATLVKHAITPVTVLIALCQVCKSIKNKLDAMLAQRIFEALGSGVVVFKAITSELSASSK